MQACQKSDASQLHGSCRVNVVQKNNQKISVDYLTWCIRKIVRSPVNPVLMPRRRSYLDRQTGVRNLSIHDMHKKGILIRMVQKVDGFPLLRLNWI